MTGIVWRYTAREVVVHAVGVMAVVVAIFLLRRFGMLLGETAEASFPVGVVMQLLALRTAVALPSLLPVSLYLGALLGLGRLYRDGEMTALAACGLSPVQIHRGVVGVALLAAVLVAALSFWVRPWAANRLYEVQEAALRSSGVAEVVPGRFYELGAGDEQVLFAARRSDSDGSYLEEVFVQQRRGTKVSIFVAARATEFQETPLGDRYLRLIDGYRYDIEPPAADSEVTRYAELLVRTAVAVDDSEPEERAKSLAALLRSDDPSDVAEWQWRVAMPVSAVVLLLLAVPLGRVEPRGGRYGRLLLAIALYAGYRQLLGTAKAWVAEGALPAFPGLWLAHAMCLACIVILVLRDPEWRLYLRLPAVRRHGARG